jgi:recombination protein RecA
VIDKSGAFYSWKGERIGQGRDAACRWLVENAKASDEIRQRLVDKRKAENARIAGGSTPVAPEVQAVASA